MRIAMLMSLCLFLSVLLLAGCSRNDDKNGSQEDKAKAPSGQGATEEIRTERSKLSPEDRKLVEAQEFCAVADDSRLGEMGVPIKVMVKDQPVFLCCKGCQRKALADPDKTIAKVDDLKAKVKAEAGKK